VRLAHRTGGFSNAGSTAVWPGDTTGLSTLSPDHIVASWGSDYPAVSGKKAEIYAANIAATPSG
jgi:hypothetical protein